MFDDVRMSKIKETQKYPEGVAYTLTGVGFNYANYKTAAERPGPGRVFDR